MNAVIWIACALFYGLVIAGLSFCGLSLGGIPAILIAGLTILAARFLCKIRNQKRTSTHRQEEVNRTDPESYRESFAQAHAENRVTFRRPKALSVLALFLTVALVLCITLCCAMAFKLSSFMQTVSSLEAELTSQRDRSLDILNDAEESTLARLKVISEFSKAENIGFASDNFKAERGIIVVSLSDNPQEFMLTAHLENGGSVLCSYDSTLSYPPATVSFESDSSSTPTAVTVHPNYEGIVTITFSNNVNSDAFKILVIVTK